MPKQNKTLHSRPPFARMMRIHAFLREGTFPNCRTLASEIEVSERTLLRDVEFMRDQLGLPVAYDSKKRGFYYTEPVEHFLPTKISETELVAIFIAEKALAQYRGTPFERSLRSAFRKLTAGLDDQVYIGWDALDSAISFRLAGTPLMEVKTFQKVGRAVTEQLEIEFDYAGLKDKQARRRLVHPYHIACVENQWYAFAWDVERQAIRTFVISRMLNLRRTGKTFEKPADFSIKKLLGDSFGVFFAKKRHDVRVRFDPFAAQLVRERIWHPSQQMKQLPNGEIELRLKLNTLQEIERWILSWGEHAEVMSPTELKQSLKRITAKMAARY